MIHTKLTLTLLLCILPNRECWKHFFHSTPHIFLSLHHFIFPIMLYFYLSFILSLFFCSQHPIILIHDGSQLYGAKMMMILEFTHFLSFFLLFGICILMISLSYMHDVAYVFLCLFIIFYFHKNLIYFGFLGTGSWKMMHVYSVDSFKSCSG